jgi:protein-L-isoaspartate(D-aspartate) O-methyltransferase
MILLEEEKKKLIDELKYKGINDRALLEAIYKVPREKFIPSALRRFAYEDNALPIECSQTISQPFTVAYMTQVLKVKKGNKVLEIGTGSGYQSAILAELGAEVYSIERIEKLYENAKKLLDELNYEVKLKLDDGTLGWEEIAPFDRIIVTAGAPVVPERLLEQLEVGGIIVIPVGSKENQRLFIGEKTADGVSFDKYEYFRFVPLIGDEGWNSVD